MCDTQSSYDPDNAADYFDEDYYERGVETGKSLYTGYHWQPRRSYREALAIIDLLGVAEGDRLLDVGCAKGFLVRAMRDLEVDAEGCDISRYAIESTDTMWWFLWEATQKSWGSIVDGYFGFAACRDVFEHNTRDGCLALLKNIYRTCDKLMVCVPLADNGKYRIPEYHQDPSHILAYNEDQWHKLFEAVGWRLRSYHYRWRGIKDNWYAKHHAGNMICVLTH